MKFSQNVCTFTVANFLQFVRSLVPLKHHNYWNDESADIIYVTSESMQQPLKPNLNKLGLFMSLSCIIRLQD